MEHIRKLEQVQKRATKLIATLKDLSHENRLKALNLPTLKYRRLRGDMIELGIQNSNRDIRSRYSY
jgi:hypothetical protein